MLSQADLARSFIKAALKAKKLLRIYPANNIIYRNVIDEIFSIAEAYFGEYGDLVLRITPAEMLVDSESVYRGSDQGSSRPSGNTDNLALMFFNEGIRELIFKKELQKNELEEFLKLTGKDFDRDDDSSDFVSSLWEKGLEGIKITLDESIFFEGDDLRGGPGVGLGEGPAEPATTGPGEMKEADSRSAVLFLSGVISQEEISTEDSQDGISPAQREDGKLLSAYNDALYKDEVAPAVPAELTVEERGFILAETKKGLSESNGRLADILIEMLRTSRDGAEASAITKSIEDLILYALKGNDLESVLTMLHGAKNISRESISDGRGIVESRICADNVVAFCGSPVIMDQLGRMIDSTRDISEETLMEYAQLLGSKAIGPFVSLLDRLQSISARRMVNNVLIKVGREDMDMLVAGLQDPTWYVVRNIIYVLRSIGDNAVEADIIAMAHHEHPRVRLEVVKALNKFGSDKALRALKEFLDDSDSTVRLTAIAVIGKTAKESPDFRLFAKEAVLARIKNGNFDDRDFREKKSFCEALAMLNDSEADEFMIGMLKKKPIFGGRKLNESRACAAYYLGLTCSSKSVALLEKLRNSSDPLLREHVAAALQRIKE
jgi:hypothetical protein